MSQIQYDFNFGDTIFLMKKHLCPICKTEKLKKFFKIEKTMEYSENPYEMKIGKDYIIGNKTVKTPGYICEKCGNQFTIEFLKNHEKMNRK